MRHSFCALILAATFVAFSGPVAADAQVNSQQQRMKDCNAQATGITGYARQKFMSSCLSGKHPNCTPGKSKPCGNSCISIDKVCHK
jgi:hypothetical protein